MNTIFLKLEQTKKSKNGNSLVSLRTKAIDVNGEKDATKICLDFCNQINESLNLAREMGAKSIKVGGVNFSFSGKFTLYVNIDGLDYCLDNVASIWDAKNTTENSFKNGRAFFVSLYQIIRTANGQSALLTSEATKQATKLLSI